MKQSPSAGNVAALPHALEQYSDAVVAQLRQVLSHDGSGLSRLLHYHMGWVDAEGNPSQPSGGKALRPGLCLLACELAGGHWPDALPAASAVELIHRFSLIHDDIQDEDVERWHRPTVWRLWGQAKALQAGNALWCIADRALHGHGGLGMPAQVTLTMAEALSARSMEMIEGQYLDLAFEGAPHVGVAQYLDMVARKTGALMDCALFLGAFVATRDLNVARTFGRCGRLLGIAFQVRDDLLSIWGDPVATGKATGADIRRRKMSYPAVYALEQAKGAEGEELRGIYAREAVTDGDVRRVLEIMEGLETFTHGQALAGAKRAEALRTLDGLTVAPGVSEALEELEEVAGYIINRER